jgi:hypothetical protein
MSDFECEFCKNKFKTLLILNTHKKRAKYCIEIQIKNNINVSSNQLKTCEYCSKQFASNIINKHLETCKIKKEKDIEEIYKKENEELLKCLQIEKSINKKNSSINKELQNKILELENILTEKKVYVAKLESEIEYKNEDLKIFKNHVIDMAKQPKTTNNTTTNNKILSIQTPLNLNDIDHIKNLLETKYNINYVLEGQKGLAKFTVDNLLTDDGGNLKYKCTDPSRQVYKFIDESGEIQKDIDAKKITNYLGDGGLKSKTVGLASDWWTSEDGKQIPEKYQIIIEKANEITNVQNDNSKFKRELAAMTTQ